MAIKVLESDEHGNVVEKPVIGWLITTIKGVTVLAAIDYADAASELNTDGKRIQLDLTPKQSLQLGAALINMASELLQEPSGSNNS
jgi:hypothetical protein